MKTSSEPKLKSGGEPSAGFSTVPIWLVLLSGVIFFWGQFYLDRNAGSFDDRVYAPFHSWDEIVANNPVSPEEEFRRLGEAKFTQTCALCHLATGMGQEGKVPPLSGSEWVNAAGPNRIEHIVLNGLTGNINVKGQAWNQTMPPWRDNFSDKEIAAILTYVRSSFGNHAPPVSPETVTKARADKHPSPMGGEDELKHLSEQ
jgi:mono/diheme cytochrome c family protein